MPAEPPAPAWSAPSSAGRLADAGLAAAFGEAAGIGLPGEAPAPRPAAAPPPAPAGGAWAAPAAPAPAQAQGGGFLDGLLRGVRDLFRPAPQDPGLRRADAAVADVGRQGGQILERVRGVVDQAFATGRGILDRAVQFLRGLFGDVDQLLQRFKQV